MFIDTHAHLWWDSYKDDLPKVLERAKAARVERIIVPGTSVETSKKAVKLAKKYPGLIYAAVGVHPEELLNSSKVRPSLAGAAGWALPSRSDLKNAVAVGEVGIDMYSEEMRAKLGEQKELFRQQVEIAVERDLPVIVHTRQSLAETLEVLDKLPVMPRGQFHCFSHDEEGLKEVLARGFYVSFCGNIAWSKRVAKLVSLVPLKRLLLETDSPFMKPGQRNEPRDVTINGQIIADLQGQSLQALGEQTTENACKLFQISKVPNSGPESSEPR